MSLYQDCKPNSWQGRRDGQSKERVHQVVSVYNLDGNTRTFSSSHTIGLLGFACDEGVSRNLGRRGAALGPEALRKALASLCLDEKFNHKIIDYGTVSCIDENLELAQSALGEKIASLVGQRVHPLVLGGGHETSWGHFLGLKNFLQNKRWGIINFDAHFDLRPQLEGDRGSSGTPFRQIADFCKLKNMPFNYLCVSIQKHANTASLFEAARKYGVQYILADHIHQGALPQHLGRIKAFCKDLDYIYLTICLDAFSAHLCPGVSAPQPRGISYSQFSPLFKEVLASQKVCSADIVELAPPFDNDSRTAKFAASIALDIIQENSFVGIN